MNILKIHKIYLLIFVLMFFFNLVIKYEIKRTRTINKYNLNYNRRNIPSSERIKTTEPLFYSFNYLSNNYYKLNYSYNSETVDFVLRNNKRITGIIKDNKYKDFYNLITDIKVRGLDEEEYKLIKCYTKSEYLDLGEYIRYLEKNYLYPSIDAFDSYQFDKATKISKELFKRISLVNIDPSYGNYLNKKISIMYLTSMLLSSPLNNILYYDEYYSFISNITNGDYSFLSNYDYCNTLTRNYKQLFISVYKINNDNYIDAYKILDEIKITDNSNYIFSQLIILLKARSIFWYIDSNKQSLSTNDIELWKSKMLLLRNQCKFRNFIDDIDYYINEIDYL